MKLKQGLALASVWSLILLIGGCQSNESSSASCDMPGGHHLDTEISTAKTKLSNGCATEFDNFFNALLVVAEGDPGDQNKQKFSDLLLWATDRGLISKRKAEERYNRYFNIKFVSLRGEYSTCSQACASPARLQKNMQRELLDKELGLLKVAGDAAAYQRSDRLYREAELVLDATCTACGSAP